MIDDIHTEAFRDMIKAELLEARLGRTAGHPTRVIPGFETKVLLPEGVWYDRLSRRDVFGEESDEMICISFTDLTSVYHWFVDHADKMRWLAKREAEKAARKAIRKDDPEKRIENAIAADLSAAGHQVRQQVRCPAGIPDILDDTTRMIIEVKASAEPTSVMQALEQLLRYEPHFPDHSLAIGLPRNPDSPWLKRALERVGIRIIVRGH